ncbi:hypothetical protein ACFX5Q_32710 [Mesorhizobium sp. IMUNJ 23033]|uniref:hypothetical protein n=1 Tax=Mesorhizobium sp. IMUNJ 23033 TaxID=3378039 RepID=UPI00384C2933
MSLPDVRKYTKKAAPNAHRHIGPTVSEHYAMTRMLAETVNRWLSAGVCFVVREKVVDAN